MNSLPFKIDRNKRKLLEKMDISCAHRKNITQ